MATFITGLFTFALVIVCILLVLMVLMQRASSNSGMGASLGGGAAESAFGAESGNMLTNWTIKAAVAFFILSFGLYIAQMMLRESSTTVSTGELPTIEAPATPESTPGSLTEIPQEQ